MSEEYTFPVIQTERLLLRETVEQDADDIFAMHGDPELMRWFGTDPLPDLDAARGLIRKFASWRLDENPGTRWGIQTRQHARLLGTCGLFRWNPAWRKCMIGYELAVHAQKQGFMRETLSAVMSWGFKHMELNRIEAMVHPDNLASLKLLRELGFVDEGRSRQAGYWQGQYHDMLQLSLLRSEWPANDLK
ncbi:GNAT family acetyltransferase-like protein [Collimonas arenae]|uniref:GNAT family acetyltransferase-like protein n=1 Tax=Collimonas arenae TaxID=279058 RepID=A0A0A1F9P2_9BURK|nr:GNAT family protein [Collimonas arenae]AIY40379.1 GNAT family acetyltransferase-like protein [Collimonas arenae]